MSHSCSFDHADFFNTNFTIVYGGVFLRRFMLASLQDKPNTASLFSSLVIIKIVPLSFKDINEETFCLTL